MAPFSLITNLKRCLRSDPEHIPDIEFDYDGENFIVINPKKIRLDSAYYDCYPTVLLLGDYKTIFEIDADEYEIIRNISHENLNEIFLTKLRWPLGRICEECQQGTERDHESIFNVPLESIPDELKHPAVILPQIVLILMKLLSRIECLETIGAFRIDALASKTIQHEYLISSGIEADGFNIETMTTFGKMSLLKRFFRNIPGNLINRTITTLMYQASKQYDDINVLSKIIRWLLTCIPLSNYNALACLCLLLNKYSKHEESNLMSAVSLAICWSPIVFDVEIDVLMVKNMTKLLTLFITKWDKFFMIPL